MPAAESNDKRPTSHGIFASTHWSVVLVAARTASQEAEEALEKPHNVLINGKDQPRITDSGWRQHPKYRGGWMAGFARVPDTRFIVIYQTRNRVMDVLVLAAWVTALAVMIFFAWRLVRCSSSARYMEK